MKTVKRRGVVRGNVIELEGDPGVSDGAVVDVTLRPVANAESSRKPGDGFLRTEGALADDDEWDALMDEIQESRKQERREQFNS